MGAALSRAAALDDLGSLLLERIHPLIDVGKPERPIPGARSRGCTRAASNISRSCWSDSCISTSARNYLPSSLMTGFFSVPVNEPPEQPIGPEIPITEIMKAELLNEHGGFGTLPSCAGPETRR
jgi:hypothetical protein